MQSVEWDGRDDQGKLVTPIQDYHVRLRVGMYPVLDSIVGGDPYAFFSRDMGQGDHAAWAITGLEAKADGSVYVLGNGSNIGPAVLRRYDSAGNYHSTVFPPPAGKSVDSMQAWGIHTKADGSYLFKYKELDTLSLSSTLITGHRAFVANLIPSIGDSSLLLADASFNLLRVNTDGTLASTGTALGSIVQTPAMTQSTKPKTWRLQGHSFVAPTADGEHYYLSGVFADQYKRRGRSTSVTSSGFWRDGQVYKVNRASGVATIFFALEASTIITDLEMRKASSIGDSKVSPYGAFSGIAVDAQGNVFIGDRQNERVLIVDKSGSLIRQIPLANVDAIAVGPNSKSLYVTTRWGNFHQRGNLHLLKFSDWTTDSKPSSTVVLARQVGVYPQRSYLAVTRDHDSTLVWAAYTELPVNIYRDNGENGLELIKDFYQASWQKSLDLQHMLVDPSTEDIFIHDGWGSCFQFNDWSQSVMKSCNIPAATKRQKRFSKWKGGALGLALDPAGKYLFARASKGAVKRFERRALDIIQAPVGSSGNEVTPPYANDWAIRKGAADRGIAVAPDGSIAVLGSMVKNDKKGPLNFYQANDSVAPWSGVFFSDFGSDPRSSGIRFDRSGNLYAGKLDGVVTGLPNALRSDKIIASSTGRIYKYAPTGTLGQGSLFPTAPIAPQKIYDIPFGAIGPRFTRSPYFGVDGYGRIYYPSSLLSRVSVVDNMGNPILSFGTWGNRDSMGGLEGDIVPTEGIPLAYPSSVDVSDNYIYVSDVVNIRLLRIEKRFKLSESAKL
ncbi:MAG: hypothetical protein ACJAZ0_003237 [Halioglobus sp.]|jgi:hypothetical protein